MDIFVRLDEEMLQKLVAGKEAITSDIQNNKFQVHIILADIGWDRMYHALDLAQTEMMERKMKDREHH